MINLIAIAAGGALGAVSRYGLNTFITNKLVTSFPIGIFSVNIIGSILIGICVALCAHLLDGSQALKAFLIVGFLGSFTTFSTFSLDTVHLLERQAYLEAFAYVFGSVLFSVGGVFLGLIITKQILI
jgi:CrcB protein